jgi:hypothetical protein
MAAFFSDLAQSIFTPGPTASLVLATNVSFACLQVVLLVLLVSTFSIHFAILSVLSAGLWAGINWFVKELALVRAQEAERKSREEADEDTETEADTAASKSLELPRAGVGSRGEAGSRSEISTEDEWERVEENEKDK